MRDIRLGILAALVVGFGFATVQAAEVSIKGAHLCCGQCVTLAKKALADVKGVSDATPDQNSKTIAFKADDDKAVEAGLTALSKAGFYGTATADKKEIKFPGKEIEKGKKAASITVSDVHLCCGQCVTGVKKALADLKGVEKIEAVQKDKTVTVTGKDIDTAEFIDALHKAGFQGELKK